MLYYNEPSCLETTKKMYFIAIALVILGLAFKSARIKLSINFIMENALKTSGRLLPLRGSAFLKLS